MDETAQTALATARLTAPPLFGLGGKDDVYRRY